MKQPPNTQWHIGIDEAGRGPLAGPVTVGLCAVSRSGIKSDLNLKTILSEVRDSKQLTEKQREDLFTKLSRYKKTSPHMRYTTVSIPATDIDTRGISWAIRTAIGRGLRRFGFDPDAVQISLDGGLKAPDVYHHQETIIKGDQIEPVISAASIIAKVTRDKYMVRQHSLFPQYGFSQHKGYGTKQHRKAIKKYGACDLHRKSWIH